MAIPAATTHRTDAEAMEVLAMVATTATTMATPTGTTTDITLATLATRMVVTWEVVPLTRTEVLVTLPVLDTIEKVQRRWKRNEVERILNASLFC